MRCTLRMFQTTKFLHRKALPNLDTKNRISPHLTFYISTHNVTIIHPHNPVSTLNNIQQELRSLGRFPTVIKS